MARNFTTEQRALLRAPEIQARLLTTWWMDDATYYYTDDVNDLVWNTQTYIGANALASATDIKAGASGWAAESVTLTIDGTRLLEGSDVDPVVLFQAILDIDLANRRVDIDLALMSPGDQDPVLVIPLYAGKINSVKITDGRHDLADMSKVASTKMEIVLDSLAARYQWIVGRTRSHEDQLEIDPTDQFYSFVQNNVIGQSTLYWGKKAPDGIGAGQLNSGLSNSGTGSDSINYD